MSMDPRRKKITQEFSIKNYMATRATLDAKVESPTFPGGQLQWSIVIYPRGKDGQNGFGAYLHLSATPNGLKTAVVRHFTLEMGAGGRPAGVVQFKNVTMQVGTEKGVETVRKEENSRKETSPLMPELDTLVVYVSFNIFPEDNEILPESFTKLPQSPHLTDFTIVSNDRRLFHTNKVVLAIRLPDVTWKKFDRQKAGGANNHAEVNCSGQTLAALMEFVYTNEISTPATMELFQLAAEWKMKRLVVICANQMADKLNIKNVAKLLQIASEWDIPQLKFAANKFVEDNKSKAGKMVKSGGQSNSAVIGQVGFEDAFKAITYGKPKRCDCDSDSDE